MKLWKATTGAESQGTLVTRPAFSLLAELLFGFDGMMISHTAGAIQITQNSHMAQWKPLCFKGWSLTEADQLAIGALAGTRHGCSGLGLRGSFRGSCRRRYGHWAVSGHPAGPTSTFLFSIGSIENLQETMDSPMIFRGFPVIFFPETNPKWSSEFC